MRSKRSIVKVLDGEVKGQAKLFQSKSLKYRFHCLFGQNTRFRCVCHMAL